MPREIVILTPTPPDLAALAAAGAAVDDRLGLRTMFDGAVHQVCRTTDVGDEAVLSLSQPVRVDNPDEITRLLPAGPTRWPGPLWWIEALAPWGEAGRRGVLVAFELAALLGGVCVVQEGEQADGVGRYAPGGAGRHGRFRLVRPD